MFSYSNELGYWIIVCSFASQPSALILTFSLTRPAMMGHLRAMFAQWLAFMSLDFTEISCLLWQHYGSQRTYSFCLIYSSYGRFARDYSKRINVTAMVQQKMMHFACSLVLMDKTDGRFPLYALVSVSHDLLLICCLAYCDGFQDVSRRQYFLHLGHREVSLFQLRVRFRRAGDLIIRLWRSRWLLHTLY